jgi:hypothetical protein
MKGVFVVGNSRSGTTLMSRILGSHSAIYQLNELHFYEELYEPKEIDLALSISEMSKLCNTLIERDELGYLEYKSKQMPKNYSYPEIPITLSNPVDAYKLALQHRIEKYHKGIFCEQTPRNAFYIEHILNAFPEAEIVFMIRDPRAVLLSQKHKWKRRYLGAAEIPRKEAIRSWANYHPFIISKMWNSIAKIAIKYENHPRVNLVIFEEFTCNPQPFLQNICSKLQIDFEPSMMEVDVKGSSTSLDKKEKGIVAKKSNEINFKGITAAEKYICERINADLILRFNFVNIQRNRTPYFGLTLNFFLFFFKSGFSLMLNLKRFKNIGKTLKKRFGW